MSERWRELLAPRMVEAIEREIQEAYRKGWQDCREALLRALEQIELGQPSEGARTDRTASGSLVRRRKRRAPRGFWAEQIVGVLRERGKPLTAPELMEEIERRAPYPLSRTSLHAALQTLEGQGKVERRGRYWSLREGNRQSYVLMSEKGPQGS